MSEYAYAPPDLAVALTRSPWINTDQPLTTGKRAVLLDIWDYTCVNCLRGLPYIQAWHQRYAAHGLQVIGVHAPSFAFGRERTQVELAAQELEIAYPIVLDNQFAIWKALDNAFWPARYLIDAEGRIRYRHTGEGLYGDLERAIQTVLREQNADVDLPPILPPLRPEDAPEVLCYRPTPELRGGLQRGALGNPEGYAGGVPILYSLPKQRHEGAFYVAGAWQAAPQHIAYQGRSSGLIQVPYNATEVNAILSPHADTVERMLHPEAISVEIWQDEQPILDEQRGTDVREDGRLLVERPRMYNLIRNHGHEQHELTLRVNVPGFAVYAFSFVGSVK